MLASCDFEMAEDFFFLYKKKGWRLASAYLMFYKVDYTDYDQLGIDQQVIECHKFFQSAKN